MQNSRPVSNSPKTGNECIQIVRYQSVSSDETTDETSDETTDRESIGSTTLTEESQQLLSPLEKLRKELEKSRIKNAALRVKLHAIRGLIADEMATRIAKEKKRNALLDKLLLVPNWTADPSCSIEAGARRDRSKEKSKRKQAKRDCVDDCNMNSKRKKKHSSLSEQSNDQVVEDEKICATTIVTIPRQSEGSIVAQSKIETSVSSLKNGKSVSTATAVAKNVSPSGNTYVITTETKLVY